MDPTLALRFVYSQSLYLYILFRLNLYGQALNIFLNSSLSDNPQARTICDRQLLQLLVEVYTQFILQTFKSTLSSSFVVSTDTPSPSVKNSSGVEKIKEELTLFVTDVLSTMDTILSTSANIGRSELLVRYYTAYILHGSIHTNNSH